MQVSTASIICMGISAAVGFLLPLLLLWYFYKKKGADLLPFVVGCAVFVLFALVLESLVHQLVLTKTAIGKTILSHYWVYALYGGLMAGLFEETGRFLAFKTVLKKKLDKNVNALMYGAGHGGIEAMILLGITMINNIVYSVVINSGQASLLTSSLTGATLAQTEEAIQSLTTLAPTYFLAGSIERVFAMILHIALSVLVFIAVKEKGKLYYFPLAILLHALVDAVTVLLSGMNVNIGLIEVAIGVMAIGIALFARNSWKSNYI